MQSKSYSAFIRPVEFPFSLTPKILDILEITPPPPKGEGVHPSPSGTLKSLKVHNLTASYRLLPIDYLKISMLGIQISA